MALVCGVMQASIFAGVHQVGFRIYIHKHRFGAGQDDGFDGGDKGVRDGDDFVAGADIQSAQDDVQRRGAVANTNPMCCTAEGGKLSFQGADIFAQEQLHSIQNLLDAL